MEWYRWVHKRDASVVYSVAEITDNYYAVFALDGRPVMIVEKAVWQENYEIEEDDNVGS